MYGIIQPGDVYSGSIFAYNKLKHIRQADGVKNGFDVMISVLSLIHYIEADVYFGVGKY
jgi:hypothetical protein